MNKYVKYCLLLVAIVLVGYKSVYFKKLSSTKTTGNEKFDAAGFSKKLWEEKLPAKLDSAVQLNVLMNAIKNNAIDAFSKYSNAMGIGNYRYSLVSVTGTVSQINPDDILLEVQLPDSTMTVTLATEYVYGNAIRDASGLVDIKNFTNNMDLNNISEELNKKVRKEILPAFKSSVKKGDTINITGAIEMNKEHIKFNQLEIIPVRLNIQ